MRPDRSAPSTPAPPVELHVLRRLAGLLLRVVLTAGAFALASPAAGVKRRAFMTSVSGTGNLATWPGATGSTAFERADSICRARAAAGGLPNSTTYRAWISTAATDAYCHAQGLSGKKATGCGGGAQPGGGPWFLANGITPFTANLATLTGGARKIVRPVRLDEFSQDAASVSDTRYWTGTNPDGTYSGYACLDWTSADPLQFTRWGSAWGTAESWTAYNATPCNLDIHLLCVEPGAGDSFAEHWGAGRIVFVTSVTGTGNLQSWPQSGGFTGSTAGHHICTTLADAAHLPRSGYFAWISDVVTDAADLLPSGAPFRRPDGYIVADSAADLLDGSTDNGWHVDEKGHYIQGQTLVWTGTAADGTLATASCTNWTSASGGIFGTSGDASMSRSDIWTDANDLACSYPFRLYCVGERVTLFWDGFEWTGDTSRWSATVP